MPPFSCLSDRKILSRHHILQGRAPGTSFGANARKLMSEKIPETYQDFALGVFCAIQDTTMLVTYSKDVAEAVWMAVANPNAPMRIPAGEDASALS
ncbi:hypothetical protein RABR111495_14495 [Rahnella bruchi]